MMIQTKPLSVTRWDPVSPALSEDVKVNFKWDYEPTVDMGDGHVTGIKFLLLYTSNKDGSPALDYHAEQEFSFAEDVSALRLADVQTMVDKAWSAYELEYRKRLMIMQSLSTERPTDQDQRRILDDLHSVRPA